MIRLPRLSVLVLLGFIHGIPAYSQTLTEPSALRFVHEIESRRAHDLDSARHEAAHRFLVVAEEILALERTGLRRLELLAEAQGIAEHIAFLDEGLAEAVPAAREARQGLIEALDKRAAELRETAAAMADPQRRAALEIQVRDLETERDELRRMAPPAVRPDTLLVAAGTVSALARVVAEEHARLKTLHQLRDELRLFLGNLRLFDEMAMPPAAQAAGGTDPDGGCPISSCPLTPGGPAGDRPLEHFRPEGGRAEGVAAAESVTLASLAQLHGLLSARVDPQWRLAEALDAGAGQVTWEMLAGAGLVTFRSRGEGMAGMAPKAGMSLFFERMLGPNAQLLVEPWLGGRAVRAGATSSAELAGEVRQTLTGIGRGGQLRWHVLAWQKGRFLSEALPAPGYLEPGRAEGGLAGRLAVPLDASRELELAGGADLVRYGPDDWAALNRHGLNTSLGIAWRGGSHAARLSAQGSLHAYSAPGIAGDPRRQDTRLGMEADWSVERRVLARVTAGVARNDSRLPDHDFWSGRVAVVVSAPMRWGSVQGYGAVAHQSFLDRVADDAQVIRSDQETGSILALQLTRAMGVNRALILRGEWARSESGFRDDFHQRFGASIQMTFRGVGRH